jgi:hypothetical protein
VDDFKNKFRPTCDTAVDQASLLATNDCSFFVPDLAKIWEFCRDYPRLNSIADVGQGMSYRSIADPRFPGGTVTVSQRRTKGFVKGFARLRESLLTNELPDPVWLNLDPLVICSRRHGAAASTPQVLLNYARVSRGPWRLKAFMDKQGHPVTSRFLVVRPLGRKCTLEFLWALLNSPLANAYSYAFSGKRDILAGLIRDLPLPRLDGVDTRSLIQAVRAYFRAARALRGGFTDAVQQERLRVLHWRIDAEVLRLYDLRTELEHQVLMLFSGELRRGVPFAQTEYLPKGFAGPVYLRDLLAITHDWDRTNDRRARLLLKEERGRLEDRQRDELAHLQRLADVRIRLVAPLPLTELDRIAADLKRRGLWAGSQT